MHFLLERGLYEFLIIKVIDFRLFYSSKMCLALILQDDFQGYFLGEFGVCFFEVVLVRFLFRQNALNKSTQNPPNIVWIHYEP